MEPFVLSFLLLASFVAAFVDSIVGGGGAISLPALLAVGFDPHLALGTNKLAATGASSMATVRYTAAGVVTLGLVLLLIPFSVVASFAGAWTALRLEASGIRYLVAVAMVAIAVFVLVRRRFGATNRFTGLRPITIAASILFATVIGFYDGLLGPGTGSFLLFAFVGVHGFDFVRAAGHARVLNFASNAAALVFFALQGRVDYAVGLPMMGSMVAGAYVGSHVGLKHGTRWVKPLFLVMTGLLLLRLVGVY